MAAKFYALLTARGEAKLAQAAALGTQLKITQMAVGDGNGTLPTPNASQTKLVKENRRAAINTLSVDPLNTSQIIAEQVIPENEGGWWIREIGLFDEAGDLIAVANCAETYKPLLAEGSGRTQVIRMILIVSSTDAVTLKIDPSVVLATRKYVDDAVIEVKAYADDLMAKHLSAADPHTQYAPKKDPTLTGTPKAPTAANGNNTTQIATTQFVQAAIGLLKGDAPLTLDTLAELAAAINNDPNFYQTMASALALKAASDSPTFTGSPKAPTAAAGSNTTQLATTQFVQTAIAQLVASAPGALDTLNELAAALGDDPNFATTIANQLALKAPLASPALTGTPTAPTPSASTSNTQIATAAFVQALLKAHLDAADPHTQYLETAKYLSEFAGLNDTTRKTLLGNLGAAGNKAFSMETNITRLDDSSVTSKTQFVSISGTIEDGPLGAVAYTATLLNIRRVWDAGTSLTQIMFQSGAMYIRTASGGEGKFSFDATPVNANGWRRIYDESAPPTAKEVGALAIMPVITTDLNNIADPGIYPVSGDAPNNPYPGAIGVLTHLNYNASRFVQEFATAQAPAATTNRRWVRYGTNSGGVSWTAWTQTTMRPNEISAGTDLNSLTESGIYYGGGFVNGPPVMVNAWGSVEVIATGTGGAITQAVHAVTANRKFIRSYNASVNGWSEWAEQARTDLIASNLVPVGIIMTWPTSTVPDGWIKCNGAAFSATAYPELAKVYTNLKVPDLRGEFIRGFDDGRGVDSGRVIATGQGATSIRTAAVDYPGIDTTTEGATVGTPYSKADSVSKGQPTDARNPGDGVLGSILSDNSIQATQFQSGIPGGAVWITMRPRNVAFNFIVRAA
ncbi:phage tail protein [Pantoea sp. MQR6]|uniref:phage tail protein n=1 Tax=Pantoea sp. MQR6 TaxID=2907307 RepID=UPI001FA9452E|nr:phage tail protein [Pantoea sp. MQR6]